MGPSVAFFPVCTRSHRNLLPLGGIDPLLHVAGSRLRNLSSDLKSSSVVALWDMQYPQ